MRAPGIVAFAFDMAQLVHEVTKVLDEPLAHKQAAITCRPRPPSMIQADRDQFKQVLLNVMQNAIEATPTGGDYYRHLTQLARRRTGTRKWPSQTMDRASAPPIAARVRTVFTSGKPRELDWGWRFAAIFSTPTAGTSHWTVSRGAAPRSRVDAITPTAATNAEEGTHAGHDLRYG